MSIKTFLVVTKKYPFGIIYNSFSWCTYDRNLKFKINYRNVFLYDIKTHKYWLFGVEPLVCSFSWFRHERYIYKFNYKRGFCKAQNESYHMTYAVKTVENLFTWCGHESVVMYCVHTK